MYRVTYVERSGLFAKTSTLTKALEEIVNEVAALGGTIVSVTPNTGLMDTLGVWVVWKEGKDS